jgi:hypothetical protein
MIHNTESPFYHKPIDIGTMVKKDGFEQRIIAIDEDIVTIEVSNKNTPFSQEQFFV